MSFSRVLVANRGEIALRIIRACQEEGLEAVAVYSDADRLSPHVRAANDAVPIGTAPSPDSYLNIQKLLEAAVKTGCGAVHPGYGFLSERAAFATGVADAGLVFVGPPATAIQAMGDKTQARRRMQAAGVPIVPGLTRALHDAADAEREAKVIGFPVLVKASAGGGGKGMRLVRSAGDVRGAYQAAQSEARKAFGDGSVYLERYVERPRHVEVQVLADTHGRVVSLGERECSIQRRHQKLIEEAPSVVVTPGLRRRMGEAATAAASAVGYVGAGTVEFLLTADGEFYFLEMNTRIQVEHPVTELVYGVDLVREQLRIAAGEPMRVASGLLQPRGHAIECRITAEDPFNGFLPATGVLQYLRVPGGPGVRWDGGIEPGNEVTLYYDPLLAKLIVWGENREVAIQRMRRALRELVIVGVPTSQVFHLRVLDDPEFRRGELDITYVDRATPRLLSEPVSGPLVVPIAVVAALLAEERRTGPAPAHVSGSGPNPPAPDGTSAAAQQTTWMRAARQQGLRDG
ncbi:MAG TPA: acetyl-CoA carboxylase biotin carboxylase subunit [Gemmatimonadales bacterium]|nr:acetyl-CoA carboxylase biotin carboxylase subunit [Gemmatimonadales bacterium]